MSWKAEVIADRSGKWVGNMLRFATENEAMQYAHDLSFRWTSVIENRVVYSHEPVNYTFDERGAQPLPKEPLDPPEATEEWFKNAKLVKPGARA